MSNPLENNKVEKLDETGDICYAYRITTPKGLEYMLMRNRPNPFMLFVVGPNMATKLKGYTWFSDGDKHKGPGTRPLRPIS